jgi:LAO/AO transport system kinase
VLLETVGVGQVEVEVAGAADTTVVVVNPGWGDAVQAAKAGLLEIADVFVINKADRPGCGETRRDLEGMLDLTMSMHDAGTEGSTSWRPPIVETVASRGEGGAELWSAVLDHRAHLERTGQLAERRAAARPGGAPDDHRPQPRAARPRPRRRRALRRAAGRRRRAAHRPYEAADELIAAAG